MATRLKTVEYWFPHLATAADASDTSFTQITVYLPETGTKTFRKVTVEICARDVATTLANVTGLNVDVQLAAAGYSAVDRVQTTTQSGEQFSITYAQDFTSYFTTNWTGTSMTMDCRVNINTSATGCRNLNAKVSITYEYDDTSTTHVKTVWIPLNAPATALATTKPGAATATIPALDTYCPEASKTFRQTALVIQGNQESAATTDSSLSYEIDTAGVFTSGLFENQSNSATSYRIANVVSFTTNATHSFYIWASLADYDHPQVWLVVTYEFNASTTTTVLNSLILPMEFHGTMGNSAANFNRHELTLYIEEPTTITTQTCALMLFWEQAGPIAGLNARVGTGSFVAHSSVATQVCGSCALMIRQDSISLARGKNTLQADIYNTDTTDPGNSVSGFWMINYHSGKATDGVGAHNHTVYWNVSPTGTAANNRSYVSATETISIPETDYYINDLGVQVCALDSGTANWAGYSVSVERLAAGEGGLLWEPALELSGGGDPEIGIHRGYGHDESSLIRWTGDTGMTRDGRARLNVETGRRWKCDASKQHSSSVSVVMTYHSILFTCADSITGFSGTVNLVLHRASDNEAVRETSRSGDGAYSFNWFDNTEEMYVTADDGTNVGRSQETLAAGSP